MVNAQPQIYQTHAILVFRHFKYFRINQGAKIEMMISGLIVSLWLIQLFLTWVSGLLDQNSMRVSTSITES